MYTLGQLRAHLSDAVGTTGDPGKNRSKQDRAIAQMVSACWWHIQDETFIDLPVDGQSTRWFIPGQDITVMPERLQQTPTGLGTARVAAPTAAPVVVASGAGGTLPTGSYRCAYAWVNLYGESGLSPVTTVAVTLGQNLVWSAPVQPTGVPAITAVHRYITAANDSQWTDGGSTATGAGSVSAPGTAPAESYPRADRIAYTDVAWVEDGDESPLLIPGVDADGSAAAIGTPGCVIQASTAPTVSDSAVTVRVRYFRRVPQPDFTMGTSPVRAPEDFAEVASLGYYLQTLVDNQAGGDMRGYGQRATAYLAQADMIYRQTVPPALPASMRKKWRV